MRVHALKSFIGKLRKRLNATRIRNRAYKRIPPWLVIKLYPKKNGKREGESSYDRLQFVVYIMVIRFYCHLMAVGILVVGKQCQKHKCRTSLYARDK